MKRIASFLLTILLVTAIIKPAQLEHTGDVSFKATYENSSGLLFLDILQSRPFESLDGQRILQTDCCLSLYRKHLIFNPLQFNGSIEKSFELEIETDAAENAGTYNTVIDFFVYPSY